MTDQQRHDDDHNPAEIYDRYLVPSLIAPLTPEVLLRADPRPGERVCDVACGTGAATRGAAALVGTSGAVVGLDVNPAMLAIARAQPPADHTQIEWREGTAEDLPFEDGSFDLVLCQQGLQYVVNRTAATREMQRVLAPGGRVAVAVWRGIEHHPFDAALNPIVERALGTPVLTTPFALGNPHELRSLLEGAGFRDVVIDIFDFQSRFPDPERYVALFILGAASVLPEFAAMGETERHDLVNAVRRDAAETIAAYTLGDDLMMPTSAQIAVARV